jgi:RecA/RadA recombinase
MAKKKEEEKKKSSKDKDAPPTRDERATALVELINKKSRGKAQIKLASEYVLPFLTKRLPTGLLSLDVELRGGFPAGGISQIIGPKNAGKSWLYWQVIRQLQYNLGDKMKVLLAMTEMRADRSQARAAGVAISLGDEDIYRLNLGRIKNGVEPLTKEEIEHLKIEIGTIHELHGMDAEHLYDGILMAVEQNVYHLIIIDSIGAIISGAEAETESLSEKTYGGAAGVNTQFLKKLCSLITLDDDYGRTRDVCIIGINQIRDAIGDPHKEYKSPGGKMLEHSKFVDLFITSGSRLKEQESIYTATGTKQLDMVYAKEVNWRIEKGKAGMHEGARGSFIFDFRTGNADFYLDTIVMGVRSGVIQQAGAWLRLVDPSGGVILEANGKEKMLARLHEDVAEKSAKGDANTYLNMIRSYVFRKNDINIDYNWDD